MLLADGAPRAIQRAAPADARERGRRQVVALVTVFYLLLILEGALRKWLLTSYGQPLFFIRDPVVLAIYWLALRHGFFPRARALLWVGLAFGFVGLLMIAVQAFGVAAHIDKWPLLAAYGWRNYFLYIPLPFVIAGTLEQADLQRIARITFLLALPIAVLVLLQFQAPLDAPINVGFGASTAQQFHGLAVDMNHTRPMGTFTSDLGQKEFIVTAMAMLIALWIAAPAHRYLKLWQIVVVTCALLTCLAVSGSRGAMLACGIVAAAAVASAAVVREGGVSARAVMVPVAIALLAAVLYPIVFPEGYSTFMSRWTQAHEAEAQIFPGGVFGRAFYSLYDFFGFLSEAPLAGYGLGLAGNASLTLGVTIPGFSGWAESDWARHIVDLGPVLGIAFIVYRIALVAWLARICISGARRSGNQLPLLLFASCAVDLLYGEITGHGTVNGYTWLFTGLAAVAATAHARAAPAAVATDAATQPPVEALPFPNLLR
jgi:hypothetical protein